MKNLTLALAGTALVSALASSAMAAECSFSGMNIGADIGVSTLNTETKFTDSAPTNLKSNLAATGLVGGAHLEYGKQFPNRFFLGAGIYGYLSNNDKTNRAGGQLFVKTRRSNGFGIVLRPGMVFGNALLYVKAGIGSAQFKHTGEVKNNAGTATLISGDKKSRVTEFPVGAGVDFLVNEKFTVGVEGTYTFTKEQKFSLKNAAGAVLGNNQLKVKANDTKIGLRFGMKI